MAIMKFSTPHLKNLFSEGAKYDWEGTHNLMFDLAVGRKIYNEDGEELTKKEANDKMREIIFSVLDLDPASKPTRRECQRAMKNHGNEFFEIIEELVDYKIAEGFRENDFFNDFVEYRNIALGDSIEFYTEDKTILAVSRVAGSHHDFCKIESV